MLIIRAEIHITEVFMRIIVILLAALLVAPFLGGASYGANCLYLNNSRMGSRVLVLGGSSYVPVEELAERMGTFTAWFPASGVVIFNGVRINDFVKANGLVYVSAREAAAAIGGTVKFSRQTRDLYITTRGGAAKSVSSSTVMIPSVSTAVHSSTGSGDLGTVYPQSSKGDGVVRPVASGGVMMDGLRMPQDANLSGIPAPESKLATTLTSVPAVQSNGNFSEKFGKNSVFGVTVTNMEEISVIKNRFSASAGNKYFVVYVSQQNISPDVQIYTGKFTLMDENSKVYDYLEGLSNYWLSILKPGGVNYGYLVFEVPSHARPAYLVLNALNQPPLSIDLIH